MAESDPGFLISLCVWAQASLPWHLTISLQQSQGTQPMEVWLWWVGCSEGEGWRKTTLPRVWPLGVIAENKGGLCNGLGNVILFSNHVYSSFPLSTLERALESREEREGSRWEKIRTMKLQKGSISPLWCSELSLVCVVRLCRWPPLSKWGCCHVTALHPRICAKIPPHL